MKKAKKKFSPIILSVFDGIYAHIGGKSLKPVQNPDPRHKSGIYSGVNVCIFGGAEDSIKSYSSKF